MSDLVGNPEDRFSHNEARLIVRLSVLRMAILDPEYYAFMCDGVFDDGCLSQF